MPDVILVTGGSRGIGAATVLLAAERGHAVAVNYASNEVVSMLGTAERALGPVTVLINNAEFATAATLTA